MPDRRETTESTAGPHIDVATRADAPLERGADATLERGADATLERGADATLELVRRQLVTAVKRLCPPWLASQQDDIVQAALIRIHRLGTDENRTTFQASYVWKVAFSVTIDEIRRYRRRPEDALEAAGTPHLIHPTPGPEDRVLARESLAAIQACLSGLGEDRRAAVTLHLQGHSVPEAARLLKWPTKRVANLTYRGLDDLRRCLSAKGYSG